MIQIHRLSDYTQCNSLKRLFSNNYDPTKILFTTLFPQPEQRFSDAIADHVQNPYRRNSLADIDMVGVETFPCFVEKIVQEFSARTDLPDQFKVINDVDIDRLIMQILNSIEETLTENPTFQQEIDSLPKSNKSLVAELVKLCIDRTLSKEEILSSEDKSMQLISMLFQRAKDDDSTDDISWYNHMISESCISYYDKFIASATSADRIHALRKINGRMRTECSYSKPENKWLHKEMLPGDGTYDAMLTYLHKGLQPVIEESTKDIYEGFRMVMDFYQEYKSENGLIDYYDLLSAFLRLLADESFRQEMDSRYDHIIVFGTRNAKGLEGEVLYALQNLGSMNNISAVPVKSSLTSDPLPEIRPDSYCKDKSFFYKWFISCLFKRMATEHLDNSDVVVYMADGTQAEEMFQQLDSRDIAYYTSKRSLLSQEEILLLLGPVVDSEIRSILTDGERCDEPSTLINLKDDYLSVMDHLGLANLEKLDWRDDETATVSERLKHVLHILEPYLGAVAFRNSPVNRKNHVQVLFDLAKKFEEECTSGSVEKFIEFVRAYKDLSDFYVEYDTIRILDYSLEKPVDCRYIYYVEIPNMSERDLHTGVQICSYKNSKGLYVIAVPPTLTWLFHYCIDQLLKDYRVSFQSSSTYQWAKQTLVVNRSKEQIRGIMAHSPFNQRYR